MTQVGMFTLVGLSRVGDSVRYRAVYDGGDFTLYQDVVVPGDDRVEVAREISRAFRKLSSAVEHWMKLPEDERQAKITRLNAAYREESL